MIHLTSAAIFFLAAGILTSVSILSVFQVLFSVSVVYYTYQAFKNNSYQLPRSAKWLLAFVIVGFISLILNYELVPKPSKNFGRLKYYLFGIGGIFVLKIWLNQVDEKTKKIITNTFLISIIVAGLYATYQFFFILDRYRARGLTDTMRYGYGSGMLLLTLLSALLHRKVIRNWFDHRLGLLALVIGFIGMYLTYTRGALLGFICGLPFVIYYFKPRIGLIIGLVALLGVGTLSGIYLFSEGESNSRYLSNKNNASDVIRRSQWKAAIIAVQEKPILGWGLSNFHTQLKRIKHAHNLEAKEYDDAHAHNLFLEIAAGTGIVGIVLFLLWLGTWALEIFRSNDLHRALVIPFGVAFFTSSQFEVTFDANNASMIFILYSMSVASLTKKI